MAHRQPSGQPATPPHDRGNAAPSRPEDVEGDRGSAVRVAAYCERLTVVGPYDQTMNPLMWVGVAAAIVAALGVVRRLRRPSHRGRPEHDALGTVSEGWLSEQRGRKDGS